LAPFSKQRVEAVPAGHGAGSTTSTAETQKIR